MPPWGLPHPTARPYSTPVMDARRNVLFVCTGNTCRSPLAEAVCKRLLADRLGCAPADLPARGFVVGSAGVMAAAGQYASDGAVAAAGELGAELGHHHSRAVEPHLLEAATHVIAMTDGHRAYLGARFPHLGPPPELLAGGHDLPDPIGGDADEYRACARLIAHHLSRLITGWLGP